VNITSFKTIAYKTLDVVTLGRGVGRNIGGEHVKFPARFSRYYEADYEPETFRFFRAHLKPGGTLLDIGAHIGLFAVVGARLVSPGGKVFSFEPTPNTRSVLTEIVRLNGCSDVVEVRGEAVSNRRGKTVFYDTGEEISNANSLVHIDRGKTGIDVDLISVDEFVKEKGIKPDCLKIDVEGAELDLLRGARETFTTMRPFARLGLHPQQIAQNGQNLEEIWETLADYKLAPDFEGSKVDKARFCEQQSLFDVNLLPY
jgi:FkbM family methyltransferase